MKRTNVNLNIPLFFVYTFLNSFILDRGIWMLFLVFKGFSLAEIAVLETVYHLMKVLFEVPTGYVADRYGKRASLILAQTSGIAAACFMLWGDHWAAIVCGFILGGIVATFQSGATNAFFYDTLKALGKEAAYKRYNSQLYAIMLITMGASGAAGGALSEIDWAWVYAGKVALHTITLSVVLLLVEPKWDDWGDPVNGTTKNSFFRQMKEGYLFLKRNARFVSLCLYGTVLYAMSWSITFYSQVHFQNIGLNNPVIGALNGLETWVSAGVAAVAFIGERWLKKTGSLIVSGLGFTGSLLLFAFSSDPMQAVTAFLAMSVFISYVEPLLDAYLNECLPSPIRATMLSVFSMFVSGGMMMTFSVIGFLADRYTLSTALHDVLIVWVPVCLAAMFWAVTYRNDQTGRPANRGSAFPDHTGN